MRELAKSTRSTSKLTQWHPPVTTPILCYKQVLCHSLFRKALPRGPVANVDAHTIMVTVLPMGLHAVTVARRTTGLSNVEPLGGGTVHLVTHPPWEGHRSRDNKDSMASSSTKAGDKQEKARSSRDPLPINQLLDGDVEESHTRLQPLWLLNSSQDQHILPK